MDFDYQSLIGLDRDAAKQKVEKAGRLFRIVREEGVSYAVPEDYYPDRINVEIKEGKVESVTIG